MATQAEYRNGGEGCVKWIEENVVIPIIPFGETLPVYTLIGDLPDTLHPETGKSYKSFWEEQKEIIIEALVMENGFFKHRQIVFCWPRGEGKSFIVVLIMLWKFFNFPRQRIMCGANSKDQVQFVHYDEMKTVINCSPNLLGAVGSKNVREKSIAFRDGAGNIASEIKTISSFSGIFSNINAYTFSELFDQKNPKFYVRLDGSIRNIPNAVGCIDSTVSEKTHILYKLYRAFLTGEDPTLYFSYRFSENGDPADYMNPNMTKGQLASYKLKFPFGDFERFFLNTWESAAGRVFTPELIESIQYLGVDHRVNCHNTVMELIKKREEAYKHRKFIKEKNLVDNLEPTINEIKKRLWPIDEVFTLTTAQHQLRLPEVVDLEALSDIYDTNWALIGCIDRADPVKTKTSARTIVGFLAKGLAGSRSKPFTVAEGETPEYLYVLLYLAHVEDSSLEGIKNKLKLIHDGFNGLNMVGSERQGTWDLAPWCKDRHIGFEIWVSNYPRQKEMFGEFFTAVNNGRFKAPLIPIPGFKEDDLLREEMSLFDHLPPEGGKKSGFFGSPEKNKKDGVQDDAIFTIGAGMYAGRELSVFDFRERKGKMDFGSFFSAEGLLGDYR